MSLLTGLPEILAIELLASFCDVVDLCRLDSAHCSSNYRQDLLNLFQNDKLVLENFQPGNLYPDAHGFISPLKKIFVQTGTAASLWLNKRNILIGKIYLESDDGNHHRIAIPSILRYNVSKVTFLQVRHTNVVNKVSALINHCSNLKTLIIWNARNGNSKNNDLKLFSAINTQILNQITELTILYVNSMTEGVLEHLAIHCKSLQSIHFNSYPTSATAISMLLKSNSNLRKVNLKNLPFTLEMMTELAQYCPKLTHLERYSLYNARTIPRLEDWVKIINSFKHLQHLHNHEYTFIKYNNIGGKKSVDITKFSCFLDDAVGYNTLFKEIKEITSLKFNASANIPESMYDLIALLHKDTLAECDIHFSIHNSYEFVQKLVLSLCSFLKQCNYVSDLKLHYFLQISSEDWVLLAQSTGAIRSLSFFRCCSISKDDIISFIDCNKSLEHILISFCGKIGKTAMKKLESAVKKRKRLITFEHEK